MLYFALVATPGHFLCGNAKTAGYVQNAAHGPAASGITTVLCVTVVIVSKRAYLALSVKNPPTQTCKRTGCIVICAKGGYT